jgi:NTE family protein
VGVLEVLHRKRVKVEAIVGTSSGAVAGAGYALGYHPQDMRQRVLDFARSPLGQNAKLRAMLKESEDNVCRSLGDRVGRVFCKGKLVKDLFLAPSVIGGDFFRRMINFFLPDVLIESMPIPFVAVATDILTGESVIFDKGPLRQAVLASTSVPGVAPPVEVNGRLLVDGGVASLVPTTEARAQGARRLVAVNVDRALGVDDSPDLALEVYMRAGDIQAAHLNELQLGLADLVLRPAVGHIHWVDFSKAQLIMDNGRESALEAWPQLESLLQESWRERLALAWQAGVLAFRDRQGNR